MNISRTAALCFASLFLLNSCQQTDAAPRTAKPNEPQPAKTSQFSVLPPVTYKNLTIFFIEGPETTPGARLLTLKEALDQKKIIVHETGDVNELTVENLSDYEEVYIQSGDIIKGGRQDRVFETDFVVPKKSGKLPIPAFCVEQGRWRQRSNEASDRFSSSDHGLASKGLKLAAKHEKRQEAVWSQVASAQEKLGGAVNVSVQSAESASSLQLTLEDKNVAEAVDSYVARLSPSLKDRPRVIGYAFAINGQINSADVYGSHDLFQKLWPKLLKATATEAVAEQRSEVRPNVDARAVAALLDENEGKAASEEQHTPRLTLVKRETEKAVTFESYDKDDKSRMIHRNYIVK